MNLFKLFEKSVQAKPAYRPVAPVSSKQNFEPNPQRNPFFIAMNSQSQAFQETFGVNKPLSKAAFLGYDNDRALYGGSRLFILT